MDIHIFWSRSKSLEFLKIFQSSLEKSNIKWEYKDLTSSHYFISSCISELQVSTPAFYLGAATAALNQKCVTCLYFEGLPKSGNQGYVQWDLKGKER